MEQNYVTVTLCILKKWERCVILPSGGATLCFATGRRKRSCATENTVNTPACTLPTRIKK